MFLLKNKQVKIAGLKNKVMAGAKSSGYLLLISGKDNFYRREYCLQ